MSVTIYDVTYAPDIDTSWAKNPGTLTSMSGFAPVQSGVYASMTRTEVFGTLDQDDLYYAIFPQVDGTARFIGFGHEIRDYASDGTATTQASGFSTSATSWNATAWGNQII